MERRWTRSAAYPGRRLLAVLCLTLVTTMPYAQSPDEPASGLGVALNSVLALFQDLKQAWDANVTFPASKEQLVLRLDKLTQSLLTLRTAKADLTDQILTEAQIASSSDAELIWEQREKINERMGELQSIVLRVQEGLYGLLPLIPASLSSEGSDVIDRLNSGLDQKWSRLADISHQLTGVAEFVPDRIQQEGDEAVEIATQLIDAVQNFRTAVAGDSA